MNEYIVSAEQDGMRLDVFLTEQMEGSRSYIQSLIKGGHVTVGNKVGKANLRLTPNTVIHVEVPEPESVEVKAEDIPLDVLYEDHDIIIVNKPRGMVVHPAVGNYSGTLVNALLYHCKDLSGINGVIRPGIVHRIDKDTTGCIVACKNDKAHEAIAKQLENKTCHRVYKTIVVGNITHDDGLVDAPIGRDPRDRQRMKVTEENSRDARTHFHVLERFNVATYLECRLETGRTHQIRAHMKYINHPVMGDDKYGQPCPYMDTQGQVLHASELTLVHPTTGETMTFHAPLPEYFEKLLNILRKRVA